VLAGINLPMLISSPRCARPARSEQAVTAAQEAGRKLLTIASRVLTGK